MGDDSPGIGFTGNVEQVFFHPGRVEVYCPKIGDQGVMGEEEVILGRTWHGDHVAVETVPVDSQDALCPEGRLID